MNPYLNILDNILLPYRINSTLKIDNAAVNIARSPVLEFGEDFEENGGRELLNKSLYMDPGSILLYLEIYIVI